MLYPDPINIHLLNVLLIGQDSLSSSIDTLVAQDLPVPAFSNVENDCVAAREMRQLVGVGGWAWKCS